MLGQVRVSIICLRFLGLGSLGLLFVFLSLEEGFRYRITAGVSWERDISVRVNCIYYNKWWCGWGFPTGSC